MSCTILYDYYILQEPKHIKSLLGNPNFNPAGKNPSSSSFFMPLSGLNTIKMKTKLWYSTGTICAFTTTNLPQSHHSLKQMLISDLKKPCNECEGSWHIAGLDEWGIIQINLLESCHVCFGRGYNLTEIGQELWKLYKPMVQNLINEALQNKSEWSCMNWI